MRWLLLSLMLAASTASAVPLELSHQARVFDANGLPLDAPTDVSVELFDADTAGTSLWSDTFTAVPFDDGYMSLSIGSGAALDPSAFDGDDVWVELTVDGDALPRMKLASVPYAVRSATATDVSGGVVDATEIRVNGTTVIDSSGQISGSSLPGGDGNLLLELGCSNAGEIAQFDGLDWTCAANPPPHVHAASDIDSGVLDIARLPVGAGSAEVAPGDHLHGFGQLTGQLSISQIPTGTSASEVATGDHGHAPGDADTLDGQDSTDFAGAAHSHAPGDADTLDGQDSTDFAGAGHGHSVAFSDLSGSAAFGQLPVGTTATTVAQGDHTHDAASLTGTIDADSVQGLAASGGTDSTADLVALMDAKICQAKGGVWDDSTGCAEWMQRTAASVTSSERWAQCKAEFGTSYTPCNAFQALGTSMLYDGITDTTYYWLHAGGTEGQADRGTLWRDTCCSSSTISVQPRCPTGQTLGFFHNWNDGHVDSISCLTNGNAYPVLCCRNTNR